MNKTLEYPRFIEHRNPLQPTSYVCVAGPCHAVEIVETTDPHNHEPLGFQYRIHRTRATVAKRSQGGTLMTREAWFSKAAVLMLSHLESIGDLITLCEIARSRGRMSESKPDYASVIRILQSHDLEASRRAKVISRMERGRPLLG